MSVLRGVVNDVPTVVLTIAVVLATVALVVGAVVLVRRVVPGTRTGFDAEVSSQMLGVVAAMFGLLLAFVVVIQYQNFGTAQDSVEHEADALAAMVRDADAYPPPARERIRTAVGAYVHAVVDDEWPRMRSGHDAAQAWSAVAGLYAALQAFDPGPGRAAAFYDDDVRQLNAALIARRDRLAAAQTGLPSLISALIVLGTLVILGYATLVGSRSLWFHVIGAGSLALVLGFTLVVLLSLSFPFSGNLAITPDPFHSGALAQFG